MSSTRTIAGHGIIPRHIIPTDHGRNLLDGLPLSEYGLIAGAAGISVGKLSPRTQSVDIPGMSGTIDVSLRDTVTGRTYLDTREITLNVIFLGEGVDYWRTRERLAPLLGARSSMRDMTQPGEWYGVITGMEWDEHRNSFGIFTHAIGKIIMRAHPLMAGDKHEETIGTGTTSITVHGNTGAWPTIDMRADTAGTVTIANLTTGLRLSLPRQWASGQQIHVDMQHAQVTYGGSTPYYATPIDSDWWQVQPGINRIQVTGGHDITLAYREQWEA